MLNIEIVQNCRVSDLEHRDLFLRDFHVMIAGIIKASHWEIDSFRRLQRSSDEMFLGIKKGFVSKIEVTSQKIEDVAK